MKIGDLVTFRRDPRFPEKDYRVGRLYLVTRVQHGDFYCEAIDTVSSEKCEFWTSDLEIVCENSSITNA